MAVATAGLVFGESTIYAIAFCVLSFAYGGGVTSMPAIISDRLGNRNAAQSIAFAELGTLLGSLASSGLMAVMAIATSIAFSGTTMCVLGVVMLMAIYGFRRRS